MDYIEACLKKFNELPEDLINFLNSQDVLNFLDRIEKEYKIDLTFVVILIFIGELDLENLDIYLLKKFSLDQETSNRLMFEIEENILRKVVGIFEIVNNDDYILDLSDEDKKKKIINIFSEELLSQFRSSAEFLIQINAIIFETIGKEEVFLERIKRLFLDSKELLSPKKINIKEKVEDATIANWIRDFVSENGSGIFSSVALAKYLTSSKNVALLDDSEKQLLRQILKMYKNLFFFPESMENIKYEDWEIFPINKDLLQSNFRRQENRDNIVEEKRQYQVVDSAEEEVKVLKELLQKYPNKSLEKKAIESEIKKIQEK